MHEEKPLSCEVLETPEAIAAEAAAWNAIVEEGYEGYPCLTAEWYLLWLRHFATPDTRIRFLKVSRSGKSVGYFPFLLSPERHHGVEMCSLRLAGNVYSPINSPVVRPGSRPEVFDFVVREALSKMPWTVFQTGDLPLEYAGAAELHLALQNAGHESCLLPSEGNWIHEGGVTPAAYLKELDAGLRNGIKRWQKRLGGMGKLELRVVGDGVTEDDIAGYQHVYDRSWKEPEIDRTFHPAMMRWASERGVLRLFLLTLDGRPIATQLWLVKRRRAYAVKFAYDEALRERSPGALMMWRVIEHLLDVEKVETFDFLKGDDPYKKQWSNKRRQRLAILAFSPDLRGRTARWLDRELLPWVRRQPVLSAAKRRAAALIARRQGSASAQNFSPEAAAGTLSGHHDERCGSQG